VRQIDPLINPAPDPVFAGIGNFRPRDRLRARDRSSLPRSGVRRFRAGCELTQEGSI
jgi:hypothetical protein